MAKGFTITIQPNTKETQEQRKIRVQNDTANRCNVYENKKRYKRHKKHKGGNDYA
jgi:hypothetical protein